MSLQTLNENLDIIQNLVIPFLEDDLDNIQKLDDEPNDVGGLTAAELKAEFDKAGNTIKEYLNETLIPQLSDTVAEAEARATAERERVANENIRVANENVRIENEDARQENETARVNAEKARADAEAARVREEQARVDRDTGIVAQATAQANAAKASAEQAATSVGAAAQEVTKAANQVTLAQKEVQNAKGQVSLAKQEVSNAQGKVEDAEAYAKGTRNGVAVGSSDPAYQNNAKYFADQAKETIGPTVTPETLQEALAPINQSVSALQTRVQPINLGGTGATTAAQALANLGGIAAGAVGNVHVWKRVQTLHNGADAVFEAVLTDTSQVIVGIPAAGSTVSVETQYSDSVSIDSSGKISLNSPTTATLTYSASYGVPTEILGKYVIIPGRSDTVYFIPTTATCTYESSSVCLNNVKTVTSNEVSPAVPPGTYTDYLSSTDRNAYTDGTVDNTTITYLGQLGEPNVKIEVRSYVGTGTRGANNALTISASGEIVLLVMLKWKDSYGNYTNVLNKGGSISDMIPSTLSTSYVQSYGSWGYGSGEPTNAKRSADGKSVSWYSTYDAENQFNVSGATYYYLIIYK